MDTTAIETTTAEVGSPKTSVAGMSIVPAGDALVRAAAPIAEIEDAFREYSALCDRLLRATDYQDISGKQFRTKSAWRKLAVAFGVSCELVDRAYERDDRHRIIRAEIVTRATAPNGRTMDGLGACDAFERCCFEADCYKVRYSNHSCCDAKGAVCNGFRHFSKPGHDIPATAHTRATNRACADLFGMGEVSAEEVSHGDVAPAPQSQDDDRPPQSQAQRSPSAPPPPAAPIPPGFDSAEQAAAEHKALQDRNRQLPDEYREPVREHVKASGWPMSKANLAVMATLVAEAEMKVREELGAPFGPESETDAPAAAPETVPLPVLSDAAVTRIIANVDPAEVKRLTNEAKALDAATLDGALEANGQTTEGKIDARRMRLVAVSILISQDGPPEPQDGPQAEDGGNPRAETPRAEDQPESGGSDDAGAPAETGTLV